MTLAWSHYLNARNFGDARRLAESAIREDSTRYDAHELMYLLHRRERNFDSLFPHLVEMLKQDRNENLVYAWRPIYLEPLDAPYVWLTAEQTKQMERELTSAMNAPGRYSPILRSVIQSLLEDIHLQMGDVAKSREAVARAGRIKEWRIIGPFDNTDQLGFDEAYPPEMEIDLSKTYDGIRRKITWQKSAGVNFYDNVDFHNMLYPNEWGVAYAVSYVHSPEDRKAAIHVGGDDAVKIWVNDRLILADETYKMYVEDQHSRGIRLRKGWNKILAKVCQGTGSWMFSLRITTDNGSPIADLTVSTDPSVYAPGPAEGGDSGMEDAPFEVASAVTAFRKRIADNPRDERAHHFLARWYYLKDLKDESVRMFEILLEMNPRCAQYHLEAGEVFFNYGNPNRGLEEYKKAAEIDTGYVAAYLRLAKHYYNAELEDPTEEAVKLALAENPGGLEAGGLSGYLYLRKGIREAAFQRMDALVGQFPHVGWARNARGIVNEQRGFLEDAIRDYRDAIRLQYDYPNARGNLIEALQRAGKHDDAIREYDTLLALYPTSIYYHIQLADAYRSQKRYEDAERVYRHATERSPDHADVHSKWGSMLLQVNDTAAAKVHWDTALLSKPDDMGLRREIQTHFPQKYRILETYRLSENERQQMISTPISDDSYPTSSAIVFLDQTIQQVFDDGSFSEYTHVILRILNHDGVKRYGDVRLPYGSNLQIKKAVTITADGKEVEATDIESGRIAFSSVEVGSLIEYEYTTEQYWGGWMRGYFYQDFYFQRYLSPVVRAEYVLAVPTGKNVHVMVQGDSVIHDKTIVEDRDVYRWRVDLADQLDVENLAPPHRDLVSFVSVSTIPSWTHLAKWENSLIRDQYQTDSKIKEKVLELTGGMDTPEGKIRAIYNYVASQVRYTERSGAAIFGVKPHKSVNTFADGFGVCKDKAVLLIAMLKEIGVNSHYALVLTRERGITQPQIPIPRFNHAIVHIQGDGSDSGTFVDPTESYLTFGDLWGTTQGVDAYVCTGGGSGFLRTPRMDVGRSRMTSDAVVRVREDGSIVVEAYEQAYGSRAALLRKAFKGVADRKRLLELQVNAVVPGAKLRRSALSDLDDLDAPVSIQLEFTAPSFARKMNQTRFIPGIGPLRLTRGLATRDEAKYGLFLYEKMNTAGRHEYVIPQGYRVSHLPENKEIDSPYARYRLAYHQTDTSVIRETAFELKEIVIRSEHYPDFRSFCVQVDEAEAQEIGVGKQQADTSPVK